MCACEHPQGRGCAAHLGLCCAEHHMGWEQPRDRAEGTQELVSIVAVAAWRGRDAPLKCFLFSVLGGVGWGCLVQSRRCKGERKRLRLAARVLLDRRKQARHNLCSVQRSFWCLLVISSLGAQQTQAAPWEG